MSDCRNCSHTKFAHQHHRRGTDCSGCDCLKFRTLPKPFALLFKAPSRPEIRTADATSPSKSTVAA